MAWQRLAPDHRHVLFNNVGIFSCFAFITVKEAEVEYKHRKSDALKPELYNWTMIKHINQPKEEVIFNRISA